MPDTTADRFAGDLGDLVLEGPEPDTIEFFAAVEDDSQDDPDFDPYTLPDVDPDTL